MRFWSQITLVVFLLGGVTIGGIEAQKSASLKPIVVGSGNYALLMGATQGGKWVKWEKVHGKLKAGIPLSLYSATKRVGKATGKKPTASPAGGIAYVIPYAPVFESQESVIGIGSVTWNPFVRSIKVLSKSDKAVLAVVRAEMKRLKIGNKSVRVRKAWQVDLEGDGKPELLIEANSPHYDNLDNPTTSSGSAFGMVLLVAQGKTTVLDSFQMEKFSPLGHEGFRNSVLSHAIDLNGDGKLEVVVFNQVHEGQKDTVYTMKGGKPQSVLEVEDGA
jgi:hypothetical protein